MSWCNWNTCSLIKCPLNNVSKVLEIQNNSRTKKELHKKLEEFWINACEKCLSIINKEQWNT